MAPQLFKITLLLIALQVYNTPALAQNAPNLGVLTTAQCPAAKTIKAPQLYGDWLVRFTNPPLGLPTEATMQLEKHEEFSESLSGIVKRNLGKLAGASSIAGHAPRAALAGDVDDGLLLLDESSNNTSISGAWNGEIVEGSCGKEIRGTWRDTSSSAAPGAPDVPFTLSRKVGW